MMKFEAVRIQVNKRRFCFRRRRNRPYKTTRATATGTHKNPPIRIRIIPGVHPPRGIRLQNSRFPF